ncbi:MAG TPA: aldehyde dehydrogenase family protein [Polyangia bacterium]|nr:aldehyde dehydrogenase family protein [Polyangia bacterium]
MELQVTKGDVRLPTPTTIRCTDPATLQLLGEIPVVAPEEVRERVRRARAAQTQWAATRFSERRRVLGMILEHLLDHADELCDLIARDSGKTRENALLGEIWPICEKLRHTIAHGERDLAPERVSSGLLLHKRARIEYRPLGVIGVICPWNFPLQNVLGPTIPALMAGNAVVVKVSEWTSWSQPRIQRIFDEALNAAGYSTDLVQLITGFGETGAALCSSGADKIVFTGSMPNGRRVAAQCAKTLTPVILELGGKDPMIVCDDAAIDQAVHAALAGTFISSGQMCLAAERVLVFDAVYNQFVDAVVEEARKLKQGPPLSGDLVDVGAMTMPHQVEIVERLVKDAVEQGAEVRVGGKRGGLKGQFFEPTVLTGVEPHMAIAREETFGPVMCIFRVKSEDEAIRVANDTEYGLGSTVFTQDKQRGRRIADRLVAGSTVVNDFGLAYMANALPFGGVRGSGYGRLNGREGIRAMCNIKSVMEDRFALHKPVKLYPVKLGDFERTRHTIELLYRRSPLQRLESAFALVRTLFRR